MSRRHPRFAECRNMNDLVRGGFAQVVGPATDEGYLAYGTGREFVPGSENLLSNPSFETATNGLADDWIDGGAKTGAVTYSQVAGASSPFAQRMQYTGAAGDANTSIDFFSRTAPGSFAPGEDAYGQAILSGTLTGCTLGLMLLAYDSGNGWVGSGATTPVVLTTTPTVYECAYPTLPANTSKTALNITPYSLDEGDTLDIVADCAMVEKSATLSPYLDGVVIASNLVFTDLVTLTSAGVVAAGTNVAYARNSGDFYGPVVVTPTAKSAGVQTALAAAWHDPIALFNLCAPGDHIIPLDGDSRAFLKL